jgi:hypothetical protein
MRGESPKKSAFGPSGSPQSRIFYWVHTSRFFANNLIISQKVLITYQFLAGNCICVINKCDLLANKYNLLQSTIAWPTNTITQYISMLQCKWRAAGDQPVVE